MQAQKRLFVYNPYSSKKFIYLLLIFIFRVFVSQSGCGLSKYQDNKIVGGERIKPNQYPWLCSLKNDRGSHICGVTLLGIHPHVKETILVGAAHCYNEGNQFINYCLNYSHCLDLELNGQKTRHNF